MLLVITETCIYLSGWLVGRSLQLFVLGIFSSNNNVRCCEERSERDNVYQLLVVYIEGERGECVRTNQIFAGKSKRIGFNEC